MDILSRKAEKEKLAELEEMLADATLNGDITGESSVSFESEAPMPTKYSPAPPRSRQEPATDSPLAWCPPDWNRPSDVDNFDLDQNHTRIGGSFSAEGGTANATARIYSSTSSSTESLAEEEIRRKQDHNQVRRPHHSARVGPAIRKDATSRRRRRAGRVEAVSPQELESQLTAAQSQLAQKEVVTRSLQRQLDQRGEIEAQTQARAEEDLVAALAKASGLKEELARTSQLNIDGALGRQHLEQRCSVLSQDLKLSGKHTAELETQLCETRAELVRVSGALHARRGTDVVDAERAFGEELQRVQESATREARVLRQEASALRSSLDEAKTKFRKACGERDSWHEEADCLLSKVGSLQETADALRQYNESDTIDQLLGQISRWKNRAEELENLRWVSSPEGPVSFDSNSDTEGSHGRRSAEYFPLDDPEQMELVGAPSAAEGVAMPSRDQEEGQKEIRAESLNLESKALKQKLSEAKEALSMAEEEAATALTAAREETQKRNAAEGRVKGLEKEAEENAKAARKSLVARRVAKAKALDDLKLTIQQEMGAQLDRLRCEMEEQRLEGEFQEISGVDKSCQADGAAYGVDLSCQLDDATHSEDKYCQAGNAIHSEDTSCQTDDLTVAMDKSCQTDDSTSAIDKSCQAGGVIAFAEESFGRNSITPTCVTCSGNSASDIISIAASTTVLMDDKAERRIAAAVMATAVAEAGTTSWVEAFDLAKQLIQSALVSLCQHTASILGQEAYGQPEVPVPFSKEAETALNSGSSTAVVPWVPSKFTQAEATAALKVLRDSVESAVERVRLALAAHVARKMPPPPSVATSSTVSQTTTGSQTEVAAKREEAREGEALDLEWCDPQQRTTSTAAVQPNGIGEGHVKTVSSTGGAPAWERSSSMGRSSEGRHGIGGSREWRRKDLENSILVKELKLKARALRRALQRTEMEKESLERSLETHFEREKAFELEQQRIGFETQIKELHASAMAIARDFSNDGVAWR